ncbi:MAG TPA: energy transducer TonB [Bacteroidales bacterium]|nr:energy transducer TonB [Bacteroidales bacterium]
MMRFVFILFIFVTSCHWLSAQDALNYGKIREAHRLMELYNNYSGTKPIYAERCRDSAMNILDQEIVPNRKISVSFKDGNAINIVYNHISFQDFNCSLSFDFFRNTSNTTSPYASNNIVLEKLENIEPNQPFTCTFQIISPKEYFDFKSGRIINKQYSEIGSVIYIFVEILDIKLDPITVKKDESNTTANVDNRINNFKWGASNPTKDTIKQKSAMGTGPNDNNIYGIGSRSPSGYNLKGRGAKSIPRPLYTEKVEGKVVVTIKVDRDGNVIEAEAAAVGTTINNPTTWENCEEAALKAKFDAKPDAPKIQIGTITYTFITLE